VTTEQESAAVEATVAGVWRDVFGEVVSLPADCFPRRETRPTFREMTEAMLMGVERVNCWKPAEAVGHRSPGRLQHFLSRAVWDNDAVRERLARWIAGQLADEQPVLVVDETGDEKSPAP
jgi:SRSO17 transposase